MKRYLFVIGALLVAAAGCDKEPCAVCGEELTQHHVCLELTGSALQTKALDVPSLSESNAGVTYENGIYLLLITNTTGFELPATGGMGVTGLYVLGAVLVIGALIGLRRQYA